MKTAITTEMAATKTALTLPLFLTRNNKYFYGFIVGVFAVIAYLIPNHIHFFEPRYLPMFCIDRVAPFLPHTVWLYTSEYVFFIAVYIATKDMANTNKYLYSFLALQLVSNAIFF